MSFEQCLPSSLSVKNLWLMVLLLARKTNVGTAVRQRKRRMSLNGQITKPNAHEEDNKNMADRKESVKNLIMQLRRKNQRFMRYVTC